MTDPLDTTTSNVITILRAIVTLGVPSCIALFLVYQVSVWQRQDIAQIRVENQLHAGEMRQELGQVLQAMREQADNEVRTRIILRQICVNLSKTTEQQQGCFQVDPRRP